MQKTRHQIFQQMASALIHQQNGNATLALAYWENVLCLLPDEIPIHSEILEECHRLLQEEDIPGQVAAQMQYKVQSLIKRYKKECSDEEQELSQRIYRAMCQQCGDNHALAFIYWRNVLSMLSTDSLVITLTVQDFCWNAHQYLISKHTARCIDLYKQLISTFPEFLEGYLNLSLILYKSGLIHEVLPLLQQIPEAYGEKFVVIRYTELYQKIEDVLRLVGQVPYVAIESIVNDLRIENTLYPFIREEYFTDLITELVDREKRFFDKQRKSLEEKAIAKTSKQLAEEGIALGQRVTMAKNAPLEEIPRFLYDNDIRIAEVLLNNPNLTADDVLVMAQTTHVSDILALIAESRKWGTLHSIRLTILFNPQTLPKDANRLLRYLSINDLSRVFYKKDLQTEIRIRAKQRIQEIFNQLAMCEKIAVIEASSGELFKLLDDVRLNISSFLVNLIGKFHDHPDIIVNICRWNLTPTSVLALVGNNLEFTSDIRMIFALLSNPRTPTAIVASLLHAIPKNDLHYFLLNSHIPSSVRQAISTAFPDISL